MDINVPMPAVQPPRKEAEASYPLTSEPGKGGLPGLGVEFAGEIARGVLEVVPPTGGVFSNVRVRVVYGRRADEAPFVESLTIDLPHGGVTREQLKKIRMAISDVIGHIVWNKEPGYETDEKKRIHLACEFGETEIRIEDAMVCHIKGYKEVEVIKKVPVWECSGEEVPTGEDGKPIVDG
jgi:hypothetical protein